MKGRGLDIYNEEEVLKAVKKARSRKSAGLDGIALEFLKKEEEVMVNCFIN